MQETDHHLLALLGCRAVHVKNVIASIIRQCAVLERKATATKLGLLVIFR